MSAPELINAILSAGLLQFGAFEQIGRHVAYHSRLATLPSYPSVLKLAAEAVADLLAEPLPDRLVCAHDAVALATLVSQRVDVPLVVHSGASGGSARTLIGAYDVGHPAIFISLTTDFPDGFVERLAADAGAVGLQMTRWISLLTTAQPTGLPHQSAITLADVADRMLASGEITAAMAARIAAR